ncbi:MAG TPA: universal stress protein [Steroidobacteraceae bacterium]|nr:universal stress protein [Steroidobacteraceae bacterium]
MQSTYAHETFKPSVHVAVGHPAEQIVRFAESHGIDHIVVGTECTRPLRYSESVRNGRYATLPTSHQRLNTVSIGYTLLGQARLGAVEWRKPPQDE